MNHQRLRTIAALVRRFFVYSLSRPANWIVFIVIPAAVIVAIHLLLNEPGTRLLFFTVMLQACLIAALSLREKEYGIYHRILAAPVSATVYTVALFIAVFLVLTLEFTIVLTAIVLIVPAPLGVSYPVLLLVMLIFAAMASAYGIMLTAFVSTHTQGTVLANVTVIFTGMISGCFWPLSIMPDYMQTVAKILPQTWANLALRDLSGGASLGEVGLHLVVLLLYAVVFLLAFALLRRRAG
jgi:ABC-2 type transport system permease protein